MIIKSIIACFLLAVPSLATDVMVERMEGVIDEVRELRERYEDAVHKNETCISALKEQEVLLMEKGLSPSRENEHIKELEFENSKLNEALQAAKKQDKEYKRFRADFQSLEKEKERLNTSAQILVEKNHSLLAQVKSFKGSSKEINSTELLKEKEELKKELEASLKKVEKLEKVNKELVHNDRNLNTKMQILIKDNEHLVKELELTHNKRPDSDQKLQGETEAAVSATSTTTSHEYLALQKDNDALLKELEKCKNRPKRSVKKVQTSKDICTDDNPFPVLMKQEIKTETKIKNVPAEVQIPEPKERSGVYRIKGESAVYNAPKGSVIEIWEDTRSFTSNVFEEKWIRITGYFIDKRWKKAEAEMWVEEVNTVKR